MDQHRISPERNYTQSALVNIHLSQMEQRLKREINDFLGGTNFVSSSTHYSLNNTLSRLPFSMSRAGRKALPTGIDPVARPSLRTTVNFYSRSSSKSNEKSSIFRQSRTLIRSVNNSRYLDSPQTFLHDLFSAKMKDMNIQSNANTEKAFMIRMQLGLSLKKLLCANSGIAKESLLVIRKFVCKGDSVISLVLDNNCLDLECFKTIGKMIKDSHLAKLSLVSTNMNSESCQIILSSLSTNCHLVDLDLSSHEGLHRNKLGAEGLKHFSKLFNSVSTLHMLNLNGSSISDRGFKSVCQGLDQNTSLYGLQISRNLISQTLFLESGAVLANCRLCVLDLTGNSIRDKGLMLIGQLLGKRYAYNSISVHLRHLNITGNDVTLMGIEEFTGFMMVNSTLEELIIDDNKLSRSSHSLQTCKTYLSRNVSLTRLSAKNVRVESAEMVLLLQGLEKNNSIYTVDLSDNIMDELAMRTLGKVLRFNQNLKSLYLRSCSIVDNNFQFFSEGISFNSCLEKVFLERNFLKDESATLIQRFLVKRRNITVVNVEKNLMSIQECRQIAKILEDSVFINSGKADTASFYMKKVQRNVQRMERLEEEIRQLKKRQRQFRMRETEERLVAILCQIDDTSALINKQKDRIKQLQTIASFITNNQ